MMSPLRLFSQNSEESGLIKGSIEIIVDIFAIPMAFNELKRIRAGTSMTWVQRFDSIALTLERWCPPYRMKW